MIRFFDIFLSGIALIVLSPLFILVMIILKLTGEGEMFFHQKRVGKNKKNIYLFKFATMYKNSENIGTKTITIKNDPRILPVGRFLRDFKINELPQLINIFKGEMSFIGPRPLTNETFSFYSEEIQKKIASIEPGLSGVGSIVFRNEEKILSDGNNSSDIYKNFISPYKGELESWFIENRNIYTYFSLIFLTVLIVLNLQPKLIFKIYKDLPKPNKNIQNLLD